MHTEDRRIQKKESDSQTNIAKVLSIQILTMLVSVSAMLVDSILIGIYLHDEPLAAYGLTAPVTLLITAFGGMLGNGVQVLAGRYAGQKNQEGLNRTFSTAILTAVGGGALLMLALLLFSGPAAAVLGAKSPFMMKLTSEYLIGISFSFPMIAGVLVIPCFLQLGGGRRHLVIGTVLLIVLDVLFDLLNVWVFKGGMMGMALASSLSYLIGFGYILLGYFRKSIYRFSFRFVSGKILGGILYYGMLYLTYKMCVVLMSLFMNRILADRGGADYVAANSIITSVALVINAFPSGFGSTTTMLCSYYVGKEDEPGRMVFQKRIILYSVAVNVILALIFIVFAPFWVSLYHPNRQVILTAAQFGLRLFAASVVFNTINYILKNIAESIHRMRRAYIICVLNDLAAPLAAALLLCRIAGLSWIWGCYLIGQGLITGVLALFLLITHKTARRGATI